MFMKIPRIVIKKSGNFYSIYRNQLVYFSFDSRIGGRGESPERDDYNLEDSTECAHPERAFPSHDPGRALLASLRFLSTCYTVIQPIFVNGTTSDD